MESWAWWFNLLVEYPRFQLEIIKVIDLLSKMVVECLIVWIMYDVLWIIFLHLIASVFCCAWLSTWNIIYSKRISFFNWLTIAIVSLMNWGGGALIKGIKYSISLHLHRWINSLRWVHQWWKILWLLIHTASNKSHAFLLTINIWNVHQIIRSRFQLNNITYSRAYLMKLWTWSINVFMV